MEESEKRKIFQEILNDDDVREDCGKELRGMELKAYSNVMDALRADGCLDKEKKGVIDNLRKYFNISEARHIAECRRVNSNEKFLEMAERLQDIDGETTDETWTVESYGVFPPLPSFHRRPPGVRGPFPRNVMGEGQPVPEELGYPLSKFIRLNPEKFRPITDEVANLAKLKWNARVKTSHKKIQTKVSSLVARNGAMVEVGSSEESDAEMDVKPNIKLERHSPDIIDVSSPGKNVRRTSRRGVVTRTTRGPPGRKPSVEVKKVAPPPARKTNFNKGFGNKGKGKFPKIKFLKRPRSTTPEDGSSDEDVSRRNEDQINHRGTTSSISGFGPKPTIRITAPPAKSSSGGRGRGMRGRGMTRGRGRGKTISNPTMPYQHPLVKIEPGRRSQAVNTINSTQINKGLKTIKPKKPKPVSLSRRKSRLKEKEDDEMIVEWNDDDDDALIMSNKHVPIKKRKLVQEDSPSDQETELEARNHNHHQHSGKYLENGESSHKDDGRGHYLTPPNDSHHHHHGRLDVPHSYQQQQQHRSPQQLSGEETDSASEKGSVSGSRINLESPGSNSNASSPPPGGRQKQRLKSPLVPTPQLPRISIPPPVFSTSLSAAQKKRPQKHISVVDSLNLHLPTTPTASSLACSSGRRPLPSGSGIFSNQAILARAGGSPGILQKATPHILSNSKTLQRTYVPTSSSVSSSGMCVSMGGSTINITSSPINSLVSSTGTHSQILSTAGGGVQVQSNVIPGGMTLTTSAAGMLQLPGSAGNAMGINPGHGQSPIILVQKASNNCNVASAIGLQGSTIPSKTGSRAVILRRTTTQPHHQLPHAQGNVVFLDVHNKPISNQMHSFLQPVSRIITAPSEMSVLNIQSGQVSSPTVVFKTAPPIIAPAGSHRKQKFVGNNEVVFTTLPNNVPTANFRPGQNDTQMAQIEAELLEMEQEIAYEEEVVTTSPTDAGPVTPQFSAPANNSSVVYTIPISRPPAISSVSSVTNISSASDNYSLGVVEQPVSNNSGNNTTVKIINSSFSEVEGDAQNHSSQFTQNIGEDIFQTALKSSGIVFTDQQFYDVEEMCENEDGQQNNVEVMNHIIVGSQENGGKQ